MPSSELRQHVLAAARHVVVKLGTQVLHRQGDAEPGLDLAFLRDMAGQIAALRATGREVTLVCSGAIGAGCVALKLGARPSDVAELQAVAAVGQRVLMSHLHDAFAEHGIEVGQVLLTADDFDHRTRFLHIRNCIHTLHRFGCVPVVNENDTVAIEELTFGDNDALAAQITNAMRADAMILLTVVDGLLDADNNVIDLVDGTAGAKSLIRSDKSALGTGGIGTKIEAARLATEAGEIAVIANGREPDVLPRLFACEKLGTVFVPADRKLDSRSRWIGLTKRPAGTVTIDAGAARALQDKGRSLLAKGVTACQGDFVGGAVVLVRDGKGHEIARGLCNYSGAELRQVLGRHSDEFAAILGRDSYAEVIHRDNLVLSHRHNSATP